MLISQSEGMMYCANKEMIEINAKRENRWLHVFGTQFFLLIP